MAEVEPQGPVRVGEPAPDFTLPMIHREGLVSLADYRGRAPLLLAMERGLWCPFCRRHLAQLSQTCQRLAALGVETLAVVTSAAERARLYFRFRPLSPPLAADPQRSIHRAYGLPCPEVTPELMQALQAVRVNPTGELPEPMPVTAASARLNELDRFEPLDDDRQGMQQQLRQAQFTGQFLIDRAGIVRWANVEGGAEGPAGAGKFPSDEVILSIARSL